MRNGVEIRLQISIYHPVATEVNPLVDLSQGLVRVLPRPEAIREILEARLEQRFDDDLHCCLHDTICNDRNAKRSLRPVGLRDVNPSHRQGLVPLLYQTLFDVAQKQINANFLLDDLEGLSVDARGTAISLDLSICCSQNVISAYLVVQHSEFARRIRLGCSV